MVGPAGQVLPLDPRPLKNHIAVGAARLGQGNGARIPALPSLLQCLPPGNMGMPMQQDVSRLERRQMVLMKHMPVGEIEQPAAQGQTP